MQGAIVISSMTYAAYYMEAVVFLPCILQTTPHWTSFCRPIHWPKMAVVDGIAFARGGSSARPSVGVSSTPTVQIPLNCNEPGVAKLQLGEARTAQRAQEETALGYFMVRHGHVRK